MASSLVITVDPVAAPHGLHGLHGLHGAQGFTAGHGFFVAHGFAAPQGFAAPHGCFAAHGPRGLVAAHGFFAAQGFAAAHGFAAARRGTTQFDDAELTMPGAQGLHGFAEHGLQGLHAAASLKTLAPGFGDAAGFVCSATRADRSAPVAVSDATPTAIATNAGISVVPRSWNLRSSFMIYHAFSHSCSHDHIHSPIHDIYITIHKFV